jgi:hypothetical protein
MRNAAQYHRQENFGNRNMEGLANSFSIKCLVDDGWLFILSVLQFAHLFNAIGSLKTPLQKFL